METLKNRELKINFLRILNKKYTRKKSVFLFIFAHTCLSCTGSTTEKGRMVEENRRGDVVPIPSHVAIQARAFFYKRWQKQETPQERKKHCASMSVEENDIMQSQINAQSTFFK